MSVEQIQLEYFYDIDTCVFLTDTKFQNDMTSLFFPSPNMQIYKEQTQTWPLFAFACTSGICGSSQISK